MERKRREHKDRTGIIISVVVHAVVIGGLLFWLSTTELGQELIRKGLQAVRSEKDKAKEPPKPPPETRQPPPSKLPPINQGVAPKSGGGSRRALASDAPAAAGESFFADSRTQTKGASTDGKGSGESGPAKVVAPPPPPKPVIPRPLFQSAAPKSDIKQLFVQRSKDAAATESFGSEQISKTGVSDAGAIINKVSGAAVVDGKFAVIRGLSDRYVTTTLNGAEIPSPDPYRRSAPLDLFPAQIIDKVVVAKTFTPDQQGSYTGGGINIVTKSFPSKAFSNFSFGGSYNPQANLNDKFLTHDGGAYDWLGMDDGTRALPGGLSKASLPSNKQLPDPPFSAPASTTPANIARRQERLTAADRLAELTRTMGTTQFEAAPETSALNHNFSLSAGDTTHFLGLPLGLFGAFSYRHDYAFYDDGKTGRYGTGNNMEPELDSSFSDARSNETVNWSGMVNLAYQLLPGHELGFNVLYNQNSDKISQQQVGNYDLTEDSATYYKNRLIFTEKNLQTYQLKGSHQLPEVGNIKLDWLTALAYTSQLEPDVRFFNFGQDGGVNDFTKGNNPDPKQPTRYHRDLNENNRNEKIDLTVPFRNWNLDEGEAKFGLFDSYSERTFSDRGLSYSGGDPFNGRPNEYLTPSNLGYTATTNNFPNGRIDFNWHRYLDQIRDSVYDAQAGVRAVYGMIDTPVLEKLRLIGGVRLESTDLRVHSESDIASSITGRTTNDSKIVQTDLLPAAGLIWAIQTNMNLRAHYSQTIARPSFRELAAYRSYDPILDDLLDGNPNLQMTSIHNYDLRWEWFFQPGEIVSVSLFYKQLKNAIERKYLDVKGEFITFDNRKAASVYGVEFEGRKNLAFIDPLLEVFSVGGNVSLIGSQTELTEDEYNVKKDLVRGAKRTRQLYDQSPYIINLDLNYDNPYSGTTAGLIYNIAGPRITIASLNTEDVFEQPAPGLDFVLSQKLGRNLTAKITVKNLLNPTFQRTYGETSSLIYSSYKKGMSFGASLSYEF